MKTDKIKIPLDGDWTLEDLYVFPRTLSQVYSLLYAFEAILSSSRFEYRENVFTKHPWHGGYSAVNFYNNLNTLTPREERPKIISLRYASPGWIELAMVATIALNIKNIVGSFYDAGDRIVILYNNIQKEISDRELRKIKLKRKQLELDRETLNFIISSGEELAKHLGFEHYKDMNEITNNPLTTLKIILSLYRRVRTLVKYDNSGKAKFREVKRD
jgi:hypothetical protein